MPPVYWRGACLPQTVGTRQLTTKLMWAWGERSPWCGSLNTHGCIRTVPGQRRRGAPSPPPTILLPAALCSAVLALGAG